MYKYILILLSILWVGDVYAQCAIDPNLEIVNSGISPSGRDYVMKYRVPNKSIIIEDHYTLYPKSQWNDKQSPYFSSMPYARWYDYDGDGHFNEWYLMRQGTCDDSKHFIWDYDNETYESP